MGKLFNVKLLFTTDLWIVAALITTFIARVAFDNVQWLQLTINIIFILFVVINVVLFVSLITSYFSIMKEEKGNQIEHK